MIARFKRALVYFGFLLPKKLVNSLKQLKKMLKKIILIKCESNSFCIFKFILKQK